MRENGSFPSNLDASEYEKKANEAMKLVVESYEKVNTDNLEEIFNKCTEVYRQYVIALGDDAKSGK